MLGIIPTGHSLLGVTPTPALRARKRAIACSILFGLSYIALSGFHGQRAQWRSTNQYARAQSPNAAACTSVRPDLPSPECCPPGARRRGRPWLHHVSSGGRSREKLLRQFCVHELSVIEHC